VRNISKNSLYLSLFAFAFSVCAHSDVGEGLLWRVQWPKQPANYVFGTIHVDDKRVKKLSDRVTSRFNKAKTLCLEILPNRETQVSIGLAMLLSKPHSLDQILGEKLFNRLSLSLNKIGVGPVQATHLKPWAAMMLLSRPKGHGGYALDEQLYHWAEYQYKELCALETLKEQLAVFDQLSNKDQISLLVDTLDNLPMLHEMHEQLIQTYLTGNLDEIYQQSMELQTADHDLSQRLNDTLIDQRNIRMFNRMLPILNKGRSFIAVGALHLPGKKGLLNLLREQGYIVSPAGITVNPW